MRLEAKMNETFTERYIREKITPQKTRVGCLQGSITCAV